MDDGKERENSVMCLCAYFSAELVGVESVSEFSVCRKSGYVETLKKFCQGVVEIYSPVGGRVILVFVMAFVDGLHVRELPIVGCTGTWDSHMPLKSTRSKDWNCRLQLVVSY